MHLSESARGHRVGMQARRRRGFSIPEVAAAIVFFGIFAAGITLALASTISARQEVQAAGTLVSVLDDLTAEVAEQPYTTLVQNTFTVPERCDGSPTTGTSGTSCISLEGASYTITWSTVIANDTLSGTTLAGPTVTITASTVDRSGTTRTVERAVPGPVGFAVNRGVVRLQLTGDTAAGNGQSVFLLSSAGQVAAAGAFDSTGAALLRAEADNCSVTAPCSASLSSAGTGLANPSGKVLTGPASDGGIVLGNETLTTAVAEVRTQTGIRLALGARGDDGTVTAPTETGSVCLWATLRGQGGERSIPVCNRDTAGAIELTSFGAEKQRTNVITNPSIEGGTDGWSGSNATIAASGTGAVDGTNAIAITPSGASTDSFASIGGGGGGGLRLGMVAGETYTISATITTPSAQTGTVDTRGRKIVVYYRVGGNERFFASEAGPAVGTKRLSTTFTIPDTATEAFIRLYNGASSGGGVVYWDAVVLEPGRTGGSFFDGDTPGAAWAGTPDRSVSYAAAGSTGPRIAITEGTVVSFSVDHPDGGCPFTGAKSAEGRGWVTNQATCTSWTWGSEAFLETSGTASDRALPAAAQAGASVTTGNLVFAGADSRPAAGWPGQQPWSKPRTVNALSDGGTCADLTAQSCSPVTEPPENLDCPGQNCKSSFLAPPSVIATLPRQSATAAYQDAIVVTASNANNRFSLLATDVNTPVSPIRTNLVTNPSFEDDTEGWAGNSGATIARTETDALFGTASVEVTQAAAAFSGLESDPGDLYSITPGLDYVYTAYVKVPSGQPNARLFLLQHSLDSGGAIVSQSNSGIVTYTSAMGWTRVTLTFTAPAGASSVRLHVVTDATAPTAGQTFLVDGVVLEEAAAVNMLGNTSFETNLSGWAASGTGATAARVETDAYHAISSAELTAGSSATSTLETDGTRMAASAGTVYAVSSWVRVPGGQANANVSNAIVFYNSGGSSLGTGSNRVGETVTVTSSMGWTRVTSYATAPANTTSMLIRGAVMNNSSAGAKILVDGVRLQTGTTFGTYIDSSFFDGEVNGNWNGTPNASTSTSPQKTTNMTVTVTEVPASGSLALVSDGVALTNGATVLSGYTDTTQPARIAMVYASTGDVAGTGFRTFRIQATDSSVTPALSYAPGDLRFVLLTDASLPWRLSAGGATVAQGGTVTVPVRAAQVQGTAAAGVSLTGSIGAGITFPSGNTTVTDANGWGSLTLSVPATAPAGVQNLTISDTVRGRSVIVPITITPTPATISASGPTTASRPATGTSAIGTIQVTVNDGAGQANPNAPVTATVTGPAGANVYLAVGDGGCVTGASGTCDLPLTLAANATVGTYVITLRSGSATTTRNVTVS